LRLSEIATEFIYVSKIAATKYKSRGDA
jgi:hypothetical protein